MNKNIIAIFVLALLMLPNCALSQAAFNGDIITSFNAKNGLLEVKIDIDVSDSLAINFSGGAPICQALRQPDATRRESIMNFVVQKQYSNVQDLFSKGCSSFTKLFITRHTTPQQNQYLCTPNVTNGYITSVGVINATAVGYGKCSLAFMQHFDGLENYPQKTIRDIHSNTQLEINNGRAVQIASPGEEILNRIGSARIESYGELLAHVANLSEGGSYIKAFENYARSLLLDATYDVEINKGSNGRIIVTANSYGFVEESGLPPASGGNGNGPTNY